MKVHLSLTLAVGLLIAAVAPAGDAAKQELDKLQGKWKQTGIEHSAPLDGRVNTAILDMIGGQTIEYEGKNIKQFNHYFAGLEVKGDKFYFRYTRKAGQPMTEQMKGVTIDPAKSPKAIDFPAGTGKEAVLAIYELKGDTLTICFANGRVRPENFQVPAPARSKVRERILVRYAQEKP